MVSNPGCKGSSKIEDNRFAVLLFTQRLRLVFTKYLKQFVMVGIYATFAPLLKNEWCASNFGPLLFIDRMVSNDAGSYTLVKAGAAAGGGRRPAFTRV